MSTECEIVLLGLCQDSWFRAWCSFMASWTVGNLADLADKPLLKEELILSKTKVTGGGARTSERCVCHDRPHVSHPGNMVDIQHMKNLRRLSLDSTNIKGQSSVCHGLSMDHWE